MTNPRPIMKQAKCTPYKMLIVSLASIGEDSERCAKNKETPLLPHRIQHGGSWAQMDIAHTSRHWCFQKESIQSNVICNTRIDTKGSLYEIARIGEKWIYQAS